MFALVVAMIKYDGDFIVGSFRLDGLRHTFMKYWALCSTLLAWCVILCYSMCRLLEFVVCVRRTSACISARKLPRLHMQHGVVYSKDNQGPFFVFLRFSNTKNDKVKGFFVL